MVVCVLAVSDEVDEALYADLGPVRAAELIVACGDLPFDYLGYLMNCLDVPLVFVPGNHDPDLSGYQDSRAGLTIRAGLPARAPWPDGAVNADGRIVDIAGLRIAGLGGCRRYSSGPNQYSDRQQASGPGRCAAGRGGGGCAATRPSMCCSRTLRRWAWGTAPTRRTAGSARCTGSSPGSSRASCCTATSCPTTRPCRPGR